MSMDSLVQEAEDLAVHVAYHHYLENKNNPLKSFDDFAEEYWEAKIAQEEADERRMEQGQFGAGS